MFKMINGFIKINIDGFHTYLDKIGSIVDIFYKKNRNFSFSTQGSQIIIVNPSEGIENISVNPTSISMKYHKDPSFETPHKYFKEITKELFKITGYKCENIVRAGNAMQFVIDEIKSRENIKKNIFSDPQKIMNFNSLIIETKTDEKLNIQKTLDTVFDKKNKEDVFLITVDLFKSNVKYTDMLCFLREGIEYLNEEKNILEGIS